MCDILQTLDAHKSLVYTILFSFHQATVATILKPWMAHPYRKCNENPPPPRLIEHRYMICWYWLHWEWQCNSWKLQFVFLFSYTFPSMYTFYDSPSQWNGKVCPRFPTVNRNMRQLFTTSLVHSMEAFLAKLASVGDEKFNSSEDLFVMSTETQQKES